MLTCIWHRNNRFEPCGAVQVAQISGNGDEVHGGVPPLGSHIEADAVIVGRGEGAHSQQVRPEDDQASSADAQAGKWGNQYCT